MTPAEYYSNMTHLAYLWPEEFYQIRKMFEETEHVFFGWFEVNKLGQQRVRLVCDEEIYKFLTRWGYI